MKSTRSMTALACLALALICAMTVLYIRVASYDGNTVLLHSTHAKASLQTENQVNHDLGDKRREMRALTGTPGDRGDHQPTPSMLIKPAPTADADSGDLETNPGSGSRSAEKGRQGRGDGPAVIRFYDGSTRTIRKTTGDITTIYEYDAWGALRFYSVYTGKHLQYEEYRDQEGRIGYCTTYLGDRRKLSESFYPDGTRKSRGEYLSGERTGRWEFWSEEGDVNCEFYD